MQDLFRQKDAIQAIVPFLYDEMEELVRLPSRWDSYSNQRKWAAHALYHLVQGNAASLKTAVAMPGFNDGILRVARDNWTEWSFNEAEETLKTIPISYSPSQVSKCKYSELIAKELLQRQPLLLRDIARLKAD